MQTPIRILRAHVDELPNARPVLSARELDHEDRILASARALMVRFGRASLTLHALALAMRLAPAAIRRLFPDLDSILAEIITRHLRAILRTFGDIPFDHPNRQAALRAAYVAATRNAYSGTIEAHTLLIRDRHALPPDLLAPIENHRDIIGSMLANEHIETTLSLLDNPFLQPSQIEAMLAALAPSGAPPQKIKPIFPQPASTDAPALAKNPAPLTQPQIRAGPRSAAV